MDKRDENINEVVQPDLVVVCDKNKLDAKGCLGSPDLIIEILSPLTAERDFKQKFSLYEKQGVKEYWIVHPEERTVLVFKLEKNKKYGIPDRYAGKDFVKCGILDGMEIDLGLVFID